MADVELSWTDNSNNEDGFRVYRSTTAAPSFPQDYTQIDSLPPDTTSYVDWSAPADTTVTYAVTAYDTKYGESSATTDDVATPALDVQKYIAVLGEVRQEQPVAGEVREELSVAGQIREERPVAGELTEAQPAAGQVREERATAGEVREEQPVLGDTDRAED